MTRDLDEIDKKIEEFKHDDGKIEIFQDDDHITINPAKTDQSIKISKNQTKESMLMQIEESLLEIYEESPLVIKEFVVWLQDVLK